MKLKIVSLNLWHGGRLLPGVLAFLQKEQPDILMCQEVYNGHDASLLERHRSVDVLQEHFNFTAYDFAPAMMMKKWRIDQGSAVFSRFPIIARKVAFLSGEYREQDVVDSGQFQTLPRNLQHVVVDTPAGHVNIFNMHGVWDLDGDNFSEQRRKMSRIIIDATKDKPRVILAGDSNARPTNQAMMNVEKHLTSVFGRELTSTFNMRRKDNPGYASSVVDMMFVSSDIKIVSKSCPDVDISDHLPIVVEVQV